MRLIDETGNIYTDLLVLRRVAPPDTLRKGRKTFHAYWLCRCMLCDKEFSVSGTHLRSGHTRRCIDCRNRRQIIDEVGNVYDMLTVTSFSHMEHKINTTTHNAVWNCLCECGETKSIRGDHLRGGLSKSCGCAHRRNWVGERFGLLVVLEELEYDWLARGKAQCLCLCEGCGRDDVVINKTNLRTVNSGSCGCVKSANENLIARWLDKLGVKYKRNDRSDKECKDVGTLEFDFVIDYGIRIEYQGKHHYKPMTFKREVAPLTDIQRRDKIKRSYCKEKGIAYLEISYLEPNKKEVLLSFLQKNGVIS